MLMEWARVVIGVPRPEEAMLKELWSLDAFQDLAQRDRLGGPGQRVATTRPTARNKQSVTRELLKDLGEEGSRQTFGFSYPRESREFPGRGGREHRKTLEGIFALSRQLHVGQTRTELSLISSHRSEVFVEWT